MWFFADFLFVKGFDSRVEMRRGGNEKKVYFQIVERIRNSVKLFYIREKKG